MAEDTRITLRIPNDLHLALVEAAWCVQRSLNGQVIYLLGQAVRKPAPLGGIPRMGDQPIDSHPL